VIEAMEAYDYSKYTAADVKNALAHSERTPEDFLRQEPAGDEGENGSRGIFSGARK